MPHWDAGMKYMLGFKMVFYGKKYGAYRTPIETKCFFSLFVLSHILIEMFLHTNPMN